VEDDWHSVMDLRHHFIGRTGDDRKRLLFETGIWIAATGPNAGERERFP